MKQLNIIKYIFLLALTMLAENAHGSELKKFTFDVYRIADRNNEYFIFEDGEHWGHGVAINYTMSLFSYKSFEWLWDNRVHGEATNKQFREVGWMYDMSVRWKHVSMFHAHHSRHLLDMPPVKNGLRFPLDNVYGIRITLIP